MARLTNKERDLLTNLGNATPEYLTDELGSVRRQIKELQKKEGIYKEALKGRIPEEQDEVWGEKYKLTVLPQTQLRLATEPVKTLLMQLKDRALINQDQYRECFQEITFKQLRTSPREDILEATK